MKKVITFLIAFLAVATCVHATQKKPAVNGIWKMVSWKYTLPDGTSDESVKIKNAIRVYNNTHFTVYYEYESGTTETCISAYSLDGEKIKLNILYHTTPGMAGNEFTGKTSVMKNKLKHSMEIDGYKIDEFYERVE